MSLRTVGGANVAYTLEEILARANEIESFVGVVSYKDGKYWTHAAGDLKVENAIGRLEVLKRDLMEQLPPPAPKVAE